MSTAASTTEPGAGGGTAAGGRFAPAGRLARQYGGILVALLLLGIVFSVLSSRFLALDNFINIAQQVAVIAVAAFGMTFVIMLGEIDLSVGSMIAVAGMVAAQCLAHGSGIVPAAAAALLSGLAMGALNGLMVARLGLPSFIVTLATMGAFRGLVSLPTGGLPTAIDDDTWLDLGTDSLLGVPILVWIMLLLFAGSVVLQGQTVFGRRAYLTGGNAEAATYSGIRVPRVRIAAFMLSGALAAVSGMMLSSRLSSAQTNAGMGYELDAIAATVLGGTSLSGGTGSMIGTLLGTLVIGVINNGMNMLSIPYFYQLIVKGMVILVAVWLDTRNKKA
ncbi:ABC transporter permease [Rhizosaccharibacter radicis]|uniref:ABC transporter permease n=1 Tax=Rhizosaccharibacter radicis TaxID=2782605 RepID=A0ABT1VXR4_9PROT|nr:ABC transporter permease [Acetobacteraceae bacterium KSS12]